MKGNFDERLWVAHEVFDVSNCYSVDEKWAMECISDRLKEGEYLDELSPSENELALIHIKHELAGATK